MQAALKEMKTVVGMEHAVFVTWVTKDRLNSAPRRTVPSAALSAHHTTFLCGERRQDGEGLSYDFASC